jgi:drug/metabolite transporter (DMT)-like permease
MKVMEKNEKLGILLVILSGVCFGFLGIFGKYFYQLGFDTGEILSVRFLLASVILFIYFSYKYYFQHKNYFYTSRKQFIISSLLGIMGYALFSSLLFISFKFLSVSLAVMLLFTFPIFVFIGSVILYKEKINFLKVASLVLALIGLSFLFSVEVQVKSIEGVLYALAAAVFYAIYILVSEKLQKNIHALTSSYYVISASALTLIAFYKPDLMKVVAADFKVQLAFIGFGIIGTVLPLTLFLAGLQLIPSTKASILGTIEPVLASIYALIFFNEKIFFLQGVGIVLVLIADVLIINPMALRKK